MAKPKSDGIPGIEWFDGRINALIDAHKERNAHFAAIDKAIHLEWELPQKLKDLGWVYKQVELIFRQVIMAALRILADSKPRISIVPFDLSQEASNQADDNEKALEWLLSAASRRREATVVEDMVESAVRYSEITHEVVFIPEQIKNIEAANGNPNRYKAMLRRGPFMIVGHHPGTVFPRYSDAGVEEVACEEVLEPEEVIDIYGSAADPLKVYLTENKGTKLACTLRTYHSFDYRAVYARLHAPMAKTDGKSRQDGKQTLPLSLLPASGKTFEIAREKWKWPFLPWVARIGGTSLETRSDHKRRALLSDAIYADEPETLNRVKTLRYSEMVRYAGAEKQAFTSGSRTSPDSDMTAAQPRVHLDEDEKIETLQPPMPDPGMGLLYQELRADVQKSTLSEVLFGGNVPVGAAFATINLVTHSALSVLKEPRRLAEFGIADTLELMLLWAHYSKTNLVGYGRSEEGKRESYLIKWKDIQPENLYITVELTPEVPTDKQARMLAATQGVQAGIISRTRAREEIGVHNAKDEEEVITKERIWDTLLTLDLQNEQFLNSLEVREEVKAQVIAELQKNPQMLVQMLQQIMGQKGGGGGGDMAAGGSPMTPPNGQGGSPVPAETPGAGMPMGSEEMMGGAGGAGAMPMREAQSGETQGGVDVAQ